MNIFKQRLLSVARALRESPAPERFTMRRELWDYKTPGCAWGHYLLRSDLQSEFLLHSPRDLNIALYVPTNEPVCYSSAVVRHHFGLSVTEHWDIFSSWDGCGDPSTPEGAAEYIEDFCARKWPEEDLPPQVLAALNTQRGIQ